MASLRNIKKDIDYLVEEILADCYLSIYFHPEKKDEVVAIMNKAVQLRNGLYERVNSPAEKNNRRLVRKHYAQIRQDMFTGVDEIFNELSTVCKA